MEERHRRIIKEHTKQLVKDIVVNEAFLAALSTEEIFPPDMVETIRAKKANHEKIYKLLELLPKRGPTAFKKFVRVLRESYDWIADMLTAADERPTKDQFMSPVRQVALHNCRLDNPEDIDFNIIWSEVQSQFSSDEQGEITSKPSGKEMEKLLDVLARKDDMAFDDVLAVLQNHCQWLADEIEHQVSEEEKRWMKHDIRTKLSQALRKSRVPNKQKDNIIERLTEVVEKEIAKCKRGSVLNHKMEAQMNTVTKKIRLLILKDVNPLIYGSVDTDLPTTDDAQDAIEALRSKLGGLKVLQKCYEAMNITYRRGGDTLPVLLMQKIDEVQAIVKNNKLSREGEHRELQELNKKNKELERELIRLKELEGENKRLGNLRKQAKKAVRTLKDENLTMEKTKMKTDEENERLQSQLQIMEDRMSILIKGNDNLNIQNSKLQRDNQKLSATIAQLRLESGTNYISFVDRLKSVNKTIINENLRLRTKYNKLEESERQKNISLQKVLVENEFLRQQIQKLKRIGAHNSTTRGTVHEPLPPLTP